MPNAAISLTRKSSRKPQYPNLSPVSHSKMAVSLTKKKWKAPRTVESRGNFLCSCLTKILYPLPTALFFMVLVFLWSSSTTYISGRIVHVCVSSRRLSNLYCLSATTQPNAEFHLPFSNSSSLEAVKKPVPEEKLENSNLNTHPVTDEPKGDSREASDVVLGYQLTPVLEKVTGSDRIKVMRDLKGDSKEVSTEVLENPTPVPEKHTRNDRAEEIENAKRVVEEELRLHRSWKSNQNQNHPSCNGRGIYVYDLPPKFNKELVSQCHDMLPWLDFCSYFSNDALGEPIHELGDHWYNTHQYSLELIFHSRVMRHPCRVYHRNQAKLFYVPYYGGLDILRWHFKNVSNEVKDSLSLELVNWLDMQESWDKNSGKDHVFVLGKISWDFRRNSSSWGTRFLELDHMQNPIKLMIERQPWEVNDIGVPHPTYFHPHSDHDILSWQQKIISSSRKSLVSFAGAARPGVPDNIRSILINQCNSTSEDKCRVFSCSSGQCDQPDLLVRLLTESEFCLQPPGDSPTRKSVFDSLISGCIPVLFDPFTAYYQYPWHLPEDHRKYSVFIDQEEVREMKVNVVERLMQVPLKERDEMRRYIVFELMPGLVYGEPNAELSHFQDAFSITINNLLERVTKLN